MGHTLHRDWNTRGWWWKRGIIFAASLTAILIGVCLGESATSTNAEREFFSWLVDNGLDNANNLYFSTSKLGYGRGVATRTPINKSGLLLKVPINLLMNTQTVYILRFLAFIPHPPRQHTHARTLPRFLLHSFSTHFVFELFAG